LKETAETIRESRRIVQQLSLSRYKDKRQESQIRLKLVVYSFLGIDFTSILP
jgi:hypothetical protein